MRYKPTKPILGANYVPAIHTNLAATFKRIRRQQAEDAKRISEQEIERIQKVRTINRGK